MDFTTEDTDTIECLRGFTTEMLKAYKHDCQAFVNRPAYKDKQDMIKTIALINLVLDERKVH